MVNVGAPEDLSAAELAGRLLDQLAVIESFAARAGWLAINGPREGSSGAVDGVSTFGGLPGTFAAQNLGVSIEHLVTWQRMVERGILPSFAHMTLLRGALEGAATARWLIEESVGSAERIRRAVAYQLEDHRNRRAFEEGADLTNSEWPEGTMSGAGRHAELLVAMEEATVARTEVPKFTWLVDNYGPGAWAYQLASGVAHRRQWATVLMSHRKRQGDGPSMAGSSAIETTIDATSTLAMTHMALQFAGKALEEFERYLGHS